MHLLPQKLQLLQEQVKRSPQQFWFAEAVLTKRFVKATKSFSPGKWYKMQTLILRVERQSLNAFL